MAIAFRSAMRVLALGPHVDDVEIGCAGTLLRLMRQYQAKVHVAVFSDHYTQPRTIDRVKEARAAAEIMGYESLDVMNFIDTQFPQDWVNIQRAVARLREQYEPDLVFAPNYLDLHQDHQELADAARREFRYGESILHYEITQFGVVNQFYPGVFVSLDLPSSRDDAEFRNECPGASLADEKVWMLRTTMRTQLKKPLLDPVHLFGLMRMRGMQAGPQIGHAEAFAGRAIVSG